MVQVGELKIKGSLDNTGIVRGLREVNTKFDTTKQKTQSTFSSMNMLSGAVGGLAKGLLTVGGIGVAAITGLAAASPLLAPEFAKMKVEAFKLSNVFGQSLKPSAETATQKMQEFTSWMQSNQGTIDSFVNGGLIVMTGAFEDVASAIEWATDKYNAFDKKVAEYTGGTSFSEELSGTVGGVGSDIQDQGLYGAINTQVGKTLDSIAELWVNVPKQISNSLLGTNYSSSDFSLGEEAGSSGSMFGVAGGLFDIFRESFFNDVDSSGR